MLLSLPMLRPPLTCYPGPTPECQSDLKVVKTKPSRALIPVPKLRVAKVAGYRPASSPQLP
eukprot:2660433-Amphidinium_carterae.1